jgi:hypothetical protein
MRKKRGKNGVKLGGFCVNIIESPNLSVFG